MAGLWGGQLADREERADEWDHLCFGLESLIQPLIDIFNRYVKNIEYRIISNQIELYRGKFRSKF